jgi:glycosyltransferase involved in cell wall biosynthesis
MSRPLQIGISLGDITELQGGGLGEFCLQVGSRLAAARHRLADSNPAGRCRLAFHVRPALIGAFGESVAYLPVKRLHRHLHRQDEGFDLWHTLHQLSKHRPPLGAGVRLVTVHDLNYLYGRNAFSRWRHHRRTRALLSRTDALTAISRHTADDVRRHLGWTGDITVVPNGARSLVDAPQRPLAGWDTAAPRPFLLHVSRMSPSKNPEALLALAAAWPTMHFVLAGPRNHDTLALQAATRLPNVEFQFGIDEAQKAWAYAHCTGFLFPSLTEGFGLPPIEAMHFGKPVFLSRRTCLPEIGGDAADYFDDFDGVSMRAVVEQGLARWRADPGRADAIRAHAAQFDWDRAAEGYLALYARLLGLDAAAAPG